MSKSTPKVRYAGVRSSIYGPEGEFPTTEEWQKAIDKMQSYFPGSVPCAVWIVAPVNVKNYKGYCSLEFPQDQADTKEYRNILFAEEDRHTHFLNYFDEHGIKVFLQVEPGMADVEDLIDIILTKYGKHKCVIGFGVDVEWYQSVGKDENEEWQINGETYFAPVTDELASKWEERVKSYNKDFRLFLKHWIGESDIMPANYRGDIIFISDSQGFYKEGKAPEECLNAMIDEFTGY